MAFTQYKFDRQGIQALAAQKMANLQANRGVTDLLGFGLQVVAGRLEKDPRRYRDYGPYWWALKDVLRHAGYAYGEQSDPLVRRVYRFVSPVETLVAADAFRDHYLATQFVYANEFMLDAATGETYVLWDADMEALAIR